MDLKRKTTINGSLWTLLLLSLMAPYALHSVVPEILLNPLAIGLHAGVIVGIGMEVNKVYLQLPFLLRYALGGLAVAFVNIFFAMFGAFFTEFFQFVIYHVISLTWLYWTMIRIDRSRELFKELQARKSQGPS